MSEGERGDATEGPDEGLEALLRAQRPEPPPGLAERVLAATRDPLAQRRLFWREAGQLAQRALLASAAGLLIAGGLALRAVGQPRTTEVTAEAAGDDSADRVALALATTQPETSLEEGLAAGYWLFGGTE